MLTALLSRDAVGSDVSRQIIPRSSEFQPIGFYPTANCWLHLLHKDHSLVRLGSSSGIFYDLSRLLNLGYLLHPVAIMLETFRRSRGNARCPFRIDKNAARRM